MSSINGAPSNTETSPSSLFSSTSTKRSVPDGFGDEEHRSKRGGEKGAADPSEPEDGEIREEEGDGQPPNTATSSQQGSTSTVRSRLPSMPEQLVPQLITLFLASEFENSMRLILVTQSDGSEVYLQPVIAPSLAGDGCSCGFCGQDGGNEEDEEEEIGGMTDDNKTEEGHQRKA